MRFLGSLGTAALLALASLSPALAASHESSHGGTVNHTVVRTFRLEVSNAVSGRATFWVAYGPLGGRWGLVRLRATRSGVYQASVRLPAQGRTTFAYVEGQGAVRTAHGLVPGDPVITVKRFDHVSTTAPQLGLVQWQAPVG
jgi:hypothetical protein